VLVTSTLSLSMYPKDRRLIQYKCKRALMTKEQVSEYVD
jgi:hypothetical protein